MPKTVGSSAKPGPRSVIDVNSIIATQGRNHALVKQRDCYVPPLNNPALFKPEKVVWSASRQPWDYTDPDLPVS